MILLTVLVINRLMLFHQSQRSRDSEYFQAEVQTMLGDLDDKLTELSLVAAQLNQNELMQAFINEKETWVRYQYYRYIEDLLMILFSDNNQITSVGLYTLSGIRYSFNSMQSSSAVLENYDMTDPSYKETCFRLLKSYHSDKYSQYVYITPIYSLDSGEKIATLALFGPCSRLLKSEDSRFIRTWLKDAAGNSYPSAFPQEKEESFSIRLGIEVFFEQVSTYVDLTYMDMFRIMLPILAIIPLILLVVGTLLIRQLTQPVIQLSHQMKSVQENRQNSVQIARGGIELKELCCQINTMLQTIEQRNKENILIHDHLYQAELVRVEAQLYALRNQINPHFLYNTLETVGGMALSCGAREISRVTSNMASIFRYSIQEDGFAELQEEMGISEKYMYIMNIRYGYYIQYTLHIEPGLEQSMVPRMIVQPVIENALKYAFEQDTKNACISVQCLREADDLRIVLSDNGCGIPKAELEQIRIRMQEPLTLENVRRNDGLGLRNIHQRLIMRYGKAYGVTVDSQVGSGTIIEIRLPFTPNEKPKVKLFPI